MNGILPKGETNFIVLWAFLSQMASDEAATSSILKRVLRHFILALALLAIGVLSPRAAAFVQDEEVAQTGDAFFAGTVVDFSTSKITVTRTVRGQAESRSFRLTSQTKVDGKLQKSVRVTVGYVSDDNGEIATIVVVRNPIPSPPLKGKK